MSDLISLEDFKTFLDPDGETNLNDDQLVLLVDGVEAQFLSAAGRAHLPFIATANARVEFHDGTGTQRLYLDYKTLDSVGITGIVLGHDPADPQETLDPTDIDEISYAADSREVLRTDGGQWSRAGRPRVVRVTYNHAADLPDDARLAIFRVSAQVYEQRGREDAKAEKMGDVSSTMAHLALEDPVWTMAVARHSRGLLV